MVTKKGPAPSASFALAEQLISLNRVPELQRFGVSVLASLLRSPADLQLGAGDTLWEKDSPAQFFALIVEGTVRCTDGEAGDGRAETGAIIGLESAFGGMPHRYS